MEPALLLVPEEGVGHPNLLGVGHREVLDLAWKFYFLKKCLNNISRHLWGNSHEEKNLWFSPHTLLFPLGPKTFRGRLWREKSGKLCVWAKEEKRWTIRPRPTKVGKSFGK